MKQTAKQAANCRKFGLWLKRLREDQDWSQEDFVRNVNRAASGEWQMTVGTLQTYVRGGTVGIPGQFHLALHDLGIATWPGSDDLIGVGDLVRILAGSFSPPDRHEDAIYPDGLRLVKAIVGDRPPRQAALDLRVSPGDLYGVLAGDRPSERVMAKLIAAYDNFADQQRLKEAFGYGDATNPTYREKSAGSLSDNDSAMRDNQDNIIVATMTKKKSKVAAELLQQRVGARIAWASKQSGIPEERLQELLEGYEPNHGEGFELGVLFENVDQARAYLTAFDQAQP